MTIVANLATYPPRREGVIRTVARLAPQVDRLNVVLNEYAAPLEELAAFANVRQIIPAQDTKDTGKFYPDIACATYVFVVDDDILYPPDFVKRTLALFGEYGRGYLCGYHGSLYLRRRDYLLRGKFLTAMAYRSDRIADYQKRFLFHRALKSPVVVDQIATCAAVMCAEDFPPYDYMRDSQKFVDVRLARWCFERGITPVALPKPKKWLGKVSFEETIYHSFTRTNPPAVAEEIKSFAFKVPGRGKAPKRV